MRVRSRNHVRACGVHLRVNRKRSSVYRIFALDDLAMMIHQNQVRRVDLAEMHPKGVHPEMVQSFRIPGRDVTSYAFIESEARKQPKRSSKHTLTMQALFSRGGKFGWLRNVR
jgi:hypothetical protein